MERMVTPFDFLNAVSALEKPEGVIAFPTDTVYGLGCLPKNALAVEKIYRIKGRSTEKPLILMSHDAESLSPFIGSMSLSQAERFQALAKTYWPGGLTLVVPASDAVPAELTRGLKTVGIRIPQCPLLTGLFEMLPDGVLATTSANRSEQPDCTTAGQVFATFGRELDFILGQDNLGIGQPSTVAMVAANGGVTILRQGSLVLD
jgi:L-threonylcarbamoyladenylate synthase